VCLLADHTEHDVKDRSVFLSTIKQQVERSYAESIQLKEQLESRGTSMQLLETNILDAAKWEKEVREQRSRELHTKLADVEKQISALERRREELRRELRNEQTSRSEWDWASQQIATLKEDILSVRADLDASQKKVCGLRNV
jgi:chromosome segregation ATPase